ncbi:MAG: serine/threonine protein kinase, partial [Cytophagaceae bacterium]|nr:serine/threonine protein kinase [Gemmatimonadaceae bacterium]
MTAADLSAIQHALSDQYRFERLLGQGGMGEVYLARDVMLERHVAIKVLPAADAGDGEQLERFLREARTAAQLSHPHVVPIYFADQVAGQAFFVMSYVDGESLAERLRARGPLPVSDVVRTMREVSWALAYAHARGVVHRDVKPENIMLERGTGRALVTDFGIAHSQDHTRLTLDGLVVGTVHYMSPEQVQGHALDGRSDLYALGVLGFQALSGRLPFEGASASAILVAHLQSQPPSLRSVAPQVPTSIATVIDRCLSKDPAARFESGEALADALGAALEAAELEAARDEAG